MFYARSCGALLFAAFSIFVMTAANAAAIAPLEMHREAVDEQSYPWSSIGKLFNETGGSCSGVVIFRDKVLTAAHCLYNAMTKHFISAEALHFLVGYRTGRYSAHARIETYVIGAGFDPDRYEQTSNADWAVLTLTNDLPTTIEPLRLRSAVAPSGTKAILAGYPQDRAFAMTADRNCELREETQDTRLLLHTCRGIKGYSGAPILVSTGANEIQIAGIQIASVTSDGMEKMIAVPADAIRSKNDGPDYPAWAATLGREVQEVQQVCLAADNVLPAQLEFVRVRLGLEQVGSDEWRFVWPSPVEPTPAKALASLAFGSLKGP